MRDFALKVSLFGKHPSSSEYLYFGHTSEFINSVAKWIENGYEALLQSRISKRSSEVHHFCFVNKSDNTIVTGSLKLNKDSRGREYPLVIAVEISPYSSFGNSQEVMEFTKGINKKILAIFEKECSLEELKKELSQLVSYEDICNDGENKISAIFMDEKFSQANMFFRPLEINDFVKMMG